jgi:hypothetical protein
MLPIRGYRNAFAMPIEYDISPPLNMTIVVCREPITRVEFLDVLEALSSDPRYSRSMIRLIDLFSMQGGLDWKDIKYAIERMQDLAIEEGRELGDLVVLSRSTGMDFLARTMGLLPRKVPFKLTVFHTLEDAILALGLSDSASEVHRFWEENQPDYQSQSEYARNA